MRSRHPLSAACLAAFALLAAGPANAQQIIHVPGDYGTITEALEFAFGDVEIHVAPGEYHEPELVLDYGVDLVGTGEQPGDVVLHGDGDHRVLRVGVESRVENLRIVAGNASRGGGILIEEHNVILRDLEIDACQANLGGGVYTESIGELSVLLERCHITACVAATAGGAIYAFNAPLVELRDSLLAGNEAGAYGGAWACAQGQLIFDGCTVAGNRAPLGGEGSSFHGEGVTVTRTIAVDNVTDEGFLGLETVLVSDASGRAEHDCSLRWQPGWPGYLEEQLADPVADNLHADPLFCLEPGSLAGYYGLAANSPALAVNNPACGLIGAFGDACGPVAAPDTPAARCVLHAPYPNPFNPITHIDYEIARRGPVKLEIYSLDGRRVATLVDEDQAAGAHTATWAGLDDRGRSVASGVYIGRLLADETSAAVRLTLVK